MSPAPTSSSSCLTLDLRALVLKPRRGPACGRCCGWHLARGVPRPGADAGRWLAGPVLHRHRRTVRLRPRHRCRAGRPVDPHRAGRAERPPTHRRAHVRHRRDPPPRQHRGVVRPGPRRAASPGTGRARHDRRRARAHRGRSASDRRATDRRARRTTHAGTGPRPVGAAPSLPTPRQADSGVPAVRAPRLFRVRTAGGRPTGCGADVRAGDRCRRGRRQRQQHRLPGRPPARQ